MANRGRDRGSVAGRGGAGTGHGCSDPSGTLPRVAHSGSHTHHWIRRSSRGAGSQPGRHGGAPDSRQRRQDMNRLVTIALAAITVLLIGSTVMFKNKFDQTTVNLEDMKTAEATARSHYAEAFNAIAEIQDSLNAITLSEGQVKLRPQSLQAEQKLTEPSRQQVL